MYTPDDYRAAWLAAALDEHAKPHCVDPMRKAVRDDDKGIEGDRDIITGYFDACGWSFHLSQFGGIYREHPSTSWCGIFAGAMGRRIGDYLESGQCVGVALDADVTKFCMPSTSRLASASKWAASGSPRVTSYFRTGMGRQFRHVGSGRLLDAVDVLKAGVLCTVKTSGNKPDDGDHIVLVESYDAGTETVRTVEGNGRGELGDGTRGEGVVRCVRDLADFVRVYHFDLAHFETMERP